MLRKSRSSVYSKSDFKLQPPSLNATTFEVIDGEVVNCTPKRKRRSTFSALRCGDEDEKSTFERNCDHGSAAGSAGNGAGEESDVEFFGNNGLDLDFDGGAVSDSPADGRQAPLVAVPSHELGEEEARNKRRAELMQLHQVTFQQDGMFFCLFSPGTSYACASYYNVFLVCVCAGYRTCTY
jgi:hypothetical protein